VKRRYGPRNRAHLEPIEHVMSPALHPRSALASSRRRVRASMRPVLQTAIAAVVAWFVAKALLPDPRPSFACIAAVIALGASSGQRGSRAIQLTGGVVLGITIADLIVQLIGTGGLQIGVMVLLAMTAALALGGGELLVSEAAVSAILLTTLDPSSSSGFSPNRALEAVIGGAVALGVSSFLLPNDPLLEVGRAAQAVFDRLGRALERIAVGLDGREVQATEDALATIRETDRYVRELDAVILAGRETVRLAPPRRRSGEQLDRYGRTLPQLDYAVRDVRVLARNATRALREGEPISPELPPAIRQLELAVWELAGAFDDPDKAQTARDHAITAAALADDPAGAGRATAQIFGQVRSTAVDLRRAAAASVGADEPLAEAPTEELLLAAGDDAPPDGGRVPAPERAG
jgi:uncharacterized membrane protein YgaE (UPF0421/DUF939 family)